MSTLTTTHQETDGAMTAKDASPKRSVPDATEDQGIKHVRRAPNTSEKPGTHVPVTDPVDTPVAASVKIDPGLSFESKNIVRDPKFLRLSERSLAFGMLGDLIKIFENPFHADKWCRVPNIKQAAIFWCTRIRSHMAAGLGEVPEEVLDPAGVFWLYDLQQAIRRCDDAAIHIEEVRGKYGIALRLAMPYGFYEALEKLEQLEQMVLFLAKKADSFRPGALGKEGKKRDPHFGQKMVSWRANVHSFDPASAVDVPSDH